MGIQGSTRAHGARVLPQIPPSAPLYLLPSTGHPLGLPSSSWSWDHLESLLIDFVRSPSTVHSSALAADARSQGLDFPELDSLASAASEAAGHRQPATVASHVSVARRWCEWFHCWSLAFKASPIAISMHLALAAYIRARRAAPGAAPPPSDTWPRTSANPAPGPHVAVSSLESEVGRFLGILNVFNVPHPPGGGPLVKALLTAFGALDKNKRSPKRPLWVWQLIVTFQRLWSSSISLSADAASGFAAICLITIGTLRPGFGTALLASSASLAPPSLGLPAFLIEWFGATKTKPNRLPSALGGPGPPLDPVVTCIAHDLLTRTAIPFFRESRASERPASPLFCRCRRVPDTALTQTHTRHLFTWAGSLWEATSRPWSHAALTRLARDLLSRAGFPDALPYASAIHAGRLAGSIEHAELGTDEKVRDNLGQWAVLKRLMHEHYESVAIESMARATACLGRLQLTRTGHSAVSIGLPATIDLVAARPFIRALGPVDATAPVGAWIPSFLASFDPASAPPPPPPPHVLLAYEAAGVEDLDALDEQEAIWAASAPPGGAPHANPLDDCEW